MVESLGLGMVPRVVKRLATSTGEACPCLTNYLSVSIASYLSFDLLLAIMALHVEIDR